MPQHPVVEPVVFCSVDTVEQVVAVHDGTCLPLQYGLAEGGEINLMECALINVGTDVVAAPFLIVAGEMLDSGHDTALLQAPDILQGELAGQIGVFAEVFVIATA